MEEQKISRQSLYHDDSGSESESESEGVSYMPPNLEFEFVEVENYASAEPKEATQEDNHEEEEFAFPLFASTTAKEETESKDTDGNDRGRSKIIQPIQKISLREHSEERIDNKRPESYYFASYTPEEKSQFAQVAVSANDIYSQYFIQPNLRKLINLNEYNASIEKEQQKAKAKKARNRPGKKKRQSKILCRERRHQRAALAKKEEKERKLKEKQEKYGKFKRQGGRHMKKTFGKAGPGRNKSAGGKFVGGKPKYRTE